MTTTSELAEFLEALLEPIRLNATQERLLGSSGCGSKDWARIAAQLRRAHRFAKRKQMACLRRETAGYFGGGQ